MRRIVKMTFRPEEIEHFQTLFQERKHQIEGFEGCLKVDLLQDLDQVNIFFTYSLWESQAHLENYRRSSVFKEIWQLTKALFAEKAVAWSVQEVG